MKRNEKTLAEIAQSTDIDSLTIIMAVMSHSLQNDSLDDDQKKQRSEVMEACMKRISDLGSDVRLITPIGGEGMETPLRSPATFHREVMDGARETLEHVKVCPDPLHLAYILREVSGAWNPGGYHPDFVALTRSMGIDPDVMNDTIAQIRDIAIWRLREKGFGNLVDVS